MLYLINRNAKDRCAHGIMKAPPPFSYAVNGKRQIFPRPTDVWMHDMRNSVLFDHVGRSFGAFLLFVVLSTDSKMILHELNSVVV